MARRPLNPFAHLAKRRAGSEPDKAPKDEDDQDAAKKARKAGKKAEGDDEDEPVDESEQDEQDEQDEDDPKASAARARERRRCRAIVLSEAGKANPVGAFHMALDTATPRGRAISTLASLNAATAAREDVESPATIVAQAILAAGAKARGEDPKTAARDRLRDRMGEVPNARVGGDAGNSGPGPSLADRIVAAGNKRRGEA